MDEEIKRKSEEFARANRKEIAKELTDVSKYIPDNIPISVFMAGSPGAGKTEYSRNLVSFLEKDKNHRVIRIDADELRNRIPGYNGKNSYLFQTAVSLIVERIHDFSLENKQTFLLDGTFSNYNKAQDNINRSLRKNRLVIVHYVYQKPEVAWKFTKEREVLEGRNIPKDVFIEQFISSKETVKQIRNNFDSKVIIFLAKKNFITHEVEEIMEIRKTGQEIDDHIQESYTKDDLNTML
jgi:UDP-N-acetylglucosamine kinase